MDDDILGPDVRGRLQPDVNAAALERFLRALSPTLRSEILERFLRPSSPARRVASAPTGTLPAADRVGSVRFGMGPSDLQFDDPELQALFEAVFRRSRGSGAE